MNIKVYYENGKISEFDTQNFCTTEPFAKEGSGNITTEFDIRFDNSRQEGLLLKIYCYNLTVDAITHNEIDDDTGHIMPYAGREIGRAVRLVSKEEMDEMVKIEVDGQVVAWRIADTVINGMKFMSQSFLCQSQVSDASMNQQAISLFSYLTAAHPDKTEEEVCEMFGYNLKTINAIQANELAQLQITEIKQDEDRISISSDKINDDVSAGSDFDDGLSVFKAFME